MLHKLQVAMKNFRPLMKRSTQEHVGNVIKYGVAFSEVISVSYVRYKATYVPDESIRQSSI
jgi:hypothetical protein